MSLISHWFSFYGTLLMIFKVSVLAISGEVVFL